MHPEPFFIVILHSYKAFAERVVFFFALKNGIMNYCKARDGEEPPFFRVYIIQ